MKFAQVALKLPTAKPAGVRCAQLLDGERCAIFCRPERPACCSGLRPSDEMCGASRADALAWLARLEADTRPAAPLASAGDSA